jgi:hypothetical protein
MVGKQFLVDFRDIPARQIPVDSIHKSGIIPHLRGQWAEEVFNPLLGLH